MIFSQLTNQSVMGEAKFLSTRESRIVPAAGLMNQCQISANWKYLDLWNVISAGSWCWLSLLQGLWPWWADPPRVSLAATAVHWISAKLGKRVWQGPRCTSCAGLCSQGRQCWSCSWAWLGFCHDCPSLWQLPRFRVFQVVQSSSNQPRGCRVAHAGKTFSNFTAVWRCLFDSHPAPEGQKQPSNSIFIIKCRQDFASIRLRDETILANHCLWLYLYYLCKIKKIQSLD